MDTTTREQVLDRAAETLARLRTPQFWGLDRDRVGEVFAAAFTDPANPDPFNPAPRFVAELAEAVRERSGGEVSLREATNDELARMAPLIKGPAGYLVLTGPRTSVGLVLVPGFPPLLARP